MLILLLATAFASCEKEEKPVTLPPPGNMQNASASMGVNYDNQVYFDFETGAAKSVPYRAWDLAFEASPQGWRVYLNTGKFMFVANTGTTDMAAADSAGKAWKTETEHLYNDSTAFGKWTNTTGQSLNQVYVVDRGRVEHFGQPRWRKVQLLEVTDTYYRIRYSLYNNTQLTDFTIPKNSNYSLMYFSFEDNGKLADVAPEKHLWDVVFTKYTYTYYSEPVNSPYRYYLVTGALLNRWAGCENEIVKQDITQDYRPFQELTSAHMGSFTLTPLAGKIGFSWKEYDFNLGYIVYTDRYYLLRDPSQYVYKIRFIDFYDSQGNKGTASFEYQRL